MSVIALIVRFVRKALTVINDVVSALPRDAPASARSLRFADALSWVFDEALPYWAEHGVDRRDGGFVEQLGLDGRDGGVPFKRVRAQARQIYVFAHAAQMGWSPGAALAERGWAFLDRHGRRADGAWVRRMGRGGGVLDATCDAYDMAFVLFAHAWLIRLGGGPGLVASALSTLDAIEAVLAHPGGQGWLTFEGCAGSREQNPHMHMIEAAIELADATGHDRFHDLAWRIATLFHERFMDRETGILREFYCDDWSAPCPERGEIVEPGHMLEWAWILRRGERLLGIQAGDGPERLYRNALALGERKDGLIVDQVSPTGQILSGGCRSWPQTEALKAHLAAYETGDKTALRRAGRTTTNLLDLYLATDPRGCWIDQLDDQLAPKIDKIPSTTFYHVFLAFSELDRLGLASARAAMGRGDPD